MNRGGYRANSGRKPTGKNTCTVTITVTYQEKDTLRRRAEKAGRPISRFIAETMHLNEAEPES